ncbi:MAG: ribose 5-phosphate isomerase B [Spirochaetes bacterium RIFOXYC1_FULL_54_7]|nr:MAG: ribose 5-phosphate isomerase B [Spirochaetes bacterium RIFOXYC1_FULL_54_7]
MQTQFKLAIGCDLAAYDFKNRIYAELHSRGYTVTDVGCNSAQEGDYPVYARKVAELVQSGKVDKGILICGTGQGMAIAANKCKGIRCALCYDIFPALMSREHNNSNILATGAWMVSFEKAMDIIEAWLFGKYSPGRHDIRLDQLKEIEETRNA